jgi:hypothetical protein
MGDGNEYRQTGNGSGTWAKVAQSARCADDTLDPDEQFPINIKAGGTCR